MAPDTLSAYYEGLVEATFTVAEGMGMAGRVLKVRKEGKREERASVGVAGRV